MITLREAEETVLSLSREETQWLAAWLEDLLQDRRRVTEARARYSELERHPMSFEEYIEYDARSRIRHEYLAGEIFAMSGVSPRHNRLSGRLYRAFAAHLEGGPCEACVGYVQMKLSVNQDQHVYYPDVMVACGRERPGEGFITNPKLIVEVLSPSTVGVDRYEKRLNCQWIPALEEYATIAQASAEVALYRRVDDWRHIIHVALEKPIEFHAIGL